MQTLTSGDYFCHEGRECATAHTYQLRCLVECNQAEVIDCWDMVNGTTNPPVHDHEELFQDYSKRGNKAVSLIYGSITPGIQAYVSGITNPTLMWTKLCKTMGIVQNESGSTFMRDQFHHESFSAQDTIDQYICSDRYANQDDLPIG